MNDSDLMELVQLYKARWLSCVTQEEAQRLRDEIARLTPSPAEQAQMDLNAEARARRAKVGDGTPTHGVMPASNVIVGDRTIEAIVADMASAADFISEHDLFDLHRDFASLYREGAELIEELAAHIERLRKFEEYDKRLRESARRERERGDDGLGPST